MVAMSINRTYGKIAGFWLITQKPLIKTESDGGKNDQHNKIYLPCNCEVNLNPHLGVIALFSSNFNIFNTFRLIFQKL
jgi:hypothetical protein